MLLRVEHDRAKKFDALFPTPQRGPPAGGYPGPRRRNVEFSDEAMLPTANLDIVKGIIPSKSVFVLRRSQLRIRIQLLCRPGYPAWTLDLHLQMRAARLARA